MSTICLYGSASGGIDPTHVELATTVGRLIGERGHDLVYGGGGTSVMGAAEAAARAAGARTTGVMPRALMELELPPAGLGELVVTDDMRRRKAEMDARADAFIVLPGGLGTLEELFEIWVARTIGLHTKPLAVLDSGGHYAGLRSWLEGLVARGFARPMVFETIHWTDDPVDALDHLEQAPRDRVSLPSSEIVGTFVDFPAPDGEDRAAPGDPQRPAGGGAS
ncbi:TIGR00730 family Rossman fold protein [Kineococcus sp. T13]|uniref:TIGR00730 family Rossman fold protein n=1 Tax=Kineococcus vitellinus TaxID=2696565 RepID=UPI0014125A22|nr:TIGR00730 family Rossman fold protein [Kineococcus vitellinus]